MAQSMPDRGKRLWRLQLVAITLVCLGIGGLIGHRVGYNKNPHVMLPTPATDWGQVCDSAPVIVVAPTPVVSETLVVYVSGAVATPQVLTLPAGSRAADAVAAAGGATEAANLDAINLALPLANHQHLVVPTREGIAPLATTVAPTATLVMGLLVNINTATAAELEALPHIGPAMAQRIVDYREAHGPFETLEALQNVSGVGPTIFAQVRPYITLEP